MLFERIISRGLAHYSYLVGDKNDAIVIDPRRDCEVYIEKASLEGMRISHILETHRNEDYFVGSMELAKRSRGTPRVANRLLKRVRDFAQVRGNGEIDLENTRAALDMFEVDSEGLDNTDKRMLMVIIKKFSGGPVGVETLSAAMGEDRETIEEVYEPYLIQKGLLNRTNRGRVATDFAYRHFGIERSEK